MTVGVRRDITGDRGARDAYVQGVMLLKQEDTGLTTADFGIPGFAGTPAQPLSTWDLFVLWHLVAMSTSTPSGATRNAAHVGPVFLPWHRWLLLQLEVNLQRVLGDADFGLPYWDWAADGDGPVDEQPQGLVWAADCMGGDGESGNAGSVGTGPFAAGSGFRVRVWSDEDGLVWAVDRPLRRRFGVSRGFGLPTTGAVNSALTLLPYDTEPWDNNSNGFRNTLEGWTRPTGLHNLVHVWVGGDMETATSPNDPVFYLNHCNADRLWWAWQVEHRGEDGYLPGDDAPEELFRHRLSDPMLGFFTDAAVAPRDVLEVSDLYTYDRL